MPRRPVMRSRLTGERHFDQRYVQAVTTGRSTSFSENPSPGLDLVGKGGMLVLGVCALAFVQSMMNPSPNTGDSEMMQTKSGGFYVAVSPVDPETGKPDNEQDKVLHQVRNLASARLITGKSDAPTTVSDTTLSEYTRGAQMGIDGAPNNLSNYSGDNGSYWGVCDWRDTRSNLSLTNSRNRVTTVVAGNVWSGGDVLNKSSAILVRPADEQSVLYLIFGDRRAKIDPDDTAILSALRIDDEDVRSAAVVSRGLLNSIPASPDLTAPKLADAGKVSTAVPGGSVGDVLRTSDASGNNRYLAVLNDGVQPVPEVVADILVNHGGNAREVDGPTVATYPQTAQLDLSMFPSAAPAMKDPASVCMAWKRGAGSNTSETRIIYGDALPVAESANDQAVDTLEVAEGSAEVADRVVTKPGRGWYAQVTGNGDSADEAGQRMYVGDDGVRYDLKADSGEDGSTVDDVVSALGFSGSAVAIPDGVARLLPKGPDLSRSAAMVETVGRSDDAVEGAAPTSEDAEVRTDDPAPSEEQDPSEMVDESAVADRTRELIEEYGQTEEPSESGEPPADEESEQEQSEDAPAEPDTPAE